jgi:hypothetical protein
MLRDVEEVPMKRLVCVVVAILFVGCGGGGGGGNGPPVLSNLSVFPPRATLNEGVGGMLDVSGSVDFSDDGGDLLEARLEVYDSAGTLLDNLVIPIQAGGIKQGTLVGGFSVGTGVADVYVIKVNVKDSGGNVSNTLSGMFVVALPPSTTAPPTVLEPGHTVIRLSGATGLFFGSARARAVSIGPTGDVYVGDPEWGRIFRLDPVTGFKTVHAAGLPPGFPLDICWTPSGRMFATTNATTGNVWEITSGSPVPVATVPGLPGGIRGFAGDSLLVADGVDIIWKVTTLGLVTPFLTGLQNPSALSLDDAGFLYFSAVVPGGAAIFRTSTGGSPSPSPLVPMLPAADRIAVDGAGNIYASDWYSASVYKVSGGKVTLFASGFGGIGNRGGPVGLAFDGTGSLYVADGDNLWKITTP